MKENYKKWKEKQREKIIDTRNETRVNREQVKWQQQSVKWGHKHPKRGVDI